MDIVIQLEDGSIANVEIQRIGYHFPGQRCACYSADLLLRQYKSVRAASQKETFSYRDVKNVYTIVFFEKSTQEFHAFPNTWLHHFQQHSNTGLQLNLLQEYFLLPLDIFRNYKHNKPIYNRLEAWLLFLCSDDPEDIISVIEKYPEFKAMYQQIYDICQNMEKVMNMFSEELREMDRNTVRYMMDEMQAELEQTKAELSEAGAQLEEKASQLKEKDSQLEKTQQQLQDALARIAELEQADSK